VKTKSFRDSFLFKAIMNQKGNIDFGSSDSGDSSDSSESSESSEESVEARSEESSSESSESVEVQAETEEELESEIEQAIEEGASEEEVKNMIRQFTLKVNGKEYIKKIDLSNEDEVQKELQLALAGRHAMQRSAELEKAYRNDINRLKSDTASVLKELGIDPLQFSSSFIEKYLEESQKDPAELEREQKIKEYEMLKAENERLKKEREEEQRRNQMAEVEKELETDIISALEGDSELPVNPEVIAMVADSMLWAMSNGFDDITAKDVLPTVKAELQKKFRTVASSLKSPAALKALLGDDILNNLREERVQQAKKQIKIVNNLKETSSPSKTEEKPRQKISLKDFMGM